MTVSFLDINLEKLKMVINTANVVVLQPCQLFNRHRIPVRQATFGKRFHGWDGKEHILGVAVLLNGEIGKLLTVVKTVVKQRPNGYSGIDSPLDFL